MKTSQFDISSKDRTISIIFKSPRQAAAFARMEFLSRLLHSLSPDHNHIWREGKRLDSEISGWPKNIKWKRTDNLIFKGAVIGNAPFSFRQYSQILEAAMEGIVGGELSTAGNKIYKLIIASGKRLSEYRFHSKSRTIAALCVLYDLQPHPRNDLEINIPKRLGILNWPIEKSDQIQRTYGDPSKTADELRNEGWSRMGDDATMKVFRKKIGGQIMQMYHLLKKEQTLGSQMMRSNIPHKWKDGLFKSQDYTCQICLLKYPENLLEPDHRIPVIFEADKLSEDNYKQKLMTLCRFCNQQKRETTKRLPANYDWRKSSWAFPEKFELDIIRRRISMRMKRTGLSQDEIIKELGK